MEPTGIPIEVLLTHRSWVRRVARSLVLDDARADDLEQEVWVRSMLHPPRRATSLRAWLGTVLRNAATDMWRAESARSRNEGRAARLAADEAPRDIVAEADLFRRVVDAVMRLDEPYRTTVLLRHFEDLSATEIATRLGLPAETVRTRLKRGLARLREDLGAGKGDRRSLAILLLPLLREPRPAAAPLPAGAGLAGAVLGGVIVGMKSKAAVAAVLLLAGLGGWLAMAGPGSRPSPSDGGTPVGAAPAPAAPLPPPAAANEAPPAPASPATPPEGRGEDAVTGATLVVRVLADPGGEPLPGATVEARSPEGEVLGFTAAPSGEARRGGLPPGRWDLVVRAAGRVRRDRTVELGEDGETELEVRLVAGASISGIVLDDLEGTPLAGADVVVIEGGAVRSPRESAFSMPAGSPVGTARTDAAGRFRLDDVPPGEIVTVSARAAEHGGAEVSLVPQEGGEAPREVVLRLPRAATLRGRVLLPDGTPAAGATVFVLPADAEDLLTTPTVVRAGGGRMVRALSARAGEDGGYAVEGLDLGGVYAAVAIVKDFGRSLPLREIHPTAAAPVVAADFRVLEAGSLTVRVLRHDGTPVEEAEVRLFSGGLLPALTPEGGGVYVLEGPPPGPYSMQVRAPGLPYHESGIEIPEAGALAVDVVLEEGLTAAGILVDDEGNPIAGVKVILLRPWRLAGRIPPSGGESVTDAGGRFRVEGLRTGPHAVLLPRHPGGGVEDDLRVEEPAEDLRIVVPRPAGLRFRMLLPSGGRAPSTLSVGVARGGSIHRSDRTWDGGEFVLERLAPGPVVLHLDAEGYAPMEIRGTLEPGRTADLGEALLDPGLDVEGRVTGPDGAPVPGAAVSAGDHWLPSRQDLTTDRDGRFVLHHLARGKGTVTVEAEGLLSAVVPFEVPAPAPLAIVLRRGCRLTIRVAGPGGRPAAGVGARWTPLGGDPDAEGFGLTDHTGVLSARLPSGRYVVNLLEEDRTDRTGPGTSREVDLAEGGDGAVEFQVGGR